MGGILDPLRHRCADCVYLHRHRLVQGGSFTFLHSSAVLCWPSPPHARTTRVLCPPAQRIPNAGASWWVVRFLFPRTGHGFRAGNHAAAARRTDQSIIDWPHILISCSFRNSHFLTHVTADFGSWQREPRNGFQILQRNGTTDLLTRTRAYAHVLLSPPLASVFVLFCLWRFPCWDG